jgi:hypothetical protein
VPCGLEGLEELVGLEEGAQRQCIGDAEGQQQREDGAQAGASVADGFTRGTRFVGVGMVEGSGKGSSTAGTRGSSRVAGGGRH